MNKTGFVIPQGTNLCLHDELLPDLLSKALVKTVSFLQDIEPSESSLHQYADWWEHNGWLRSEKGSLTFAALFQMVQSPSTLLKAMPGDFYVFVGVAPQDFSWYLRFYLDPDAENDDLFGRFDLTLRPELIERYKAEVVRPLELAMVEQEAANYYQSLFDKNGQ